MTSCIRCNASLSFFEKLSHAGKLKVCASCEQHIDDILWRLEDQMEQASRQNTLTEQFRTHLLRELDSNRIPHEYRFEPLEKLEKLLKVLAYQKFLIDIRSGHLPIIRVDAILDTDEIAHLEIDAVYYKPNIQVRYIYGRLLATNKKLYFITSGRDSMRIDWNNVVKVDQRSGYTPTGEPKTLMQIQVSKGVGGGSYLVADPTVAVAIIETAVRIWKRHLVESKANPNTQGIPEHVKVAVFQRDGGRCRQCGYAGPYIEYDHIMPRSKGGKNTIENIQLLCRQCNLKKSNRI
jgi:hypothetical protein